MIPTKRRLSPLLHTGSEPTSSIFISLAARSALSLGRQHFGFGVITSPQVIIRSLLSVMIRKEQFPCQSGFEARAHSSDFSECVLQQNTAESLSVISDKRNKKVHRHRVSVPTSNTPLFCRLCRCAPPSTWPGGPERER